VSRLVTLRGGRALRLTTDLTVAAPLHVVDYYLFHNGIGYNVRYEGLRAKERLDAPVFAESAQTIHFTR
jgi:hypothetical protein